MATKLAPPPIYEPVIIPAISAICGISELSKNADINVPATVPSAVHEMHLNIFPLSFLTFFISAFNIKVVLQLVLLCPN